MTEIQLLWCVIGVLCLLCLCIGFALDSLSDRVRHLEVEAFHASEPRRKGAA